MIKSFTELFEQLRTTIRNSATGLGVSREAQAAMWENTLDSIKSGAVVLYHDTLDDTIPLTTTLEDFVWWEGFDGEALDVFDVNVGTGVITAKVDMAIRFSLNCVFESGNNTGLYSAIHIAGAVSRYKGHSTGIGSGDPVTVSIAGADSIKAGDEIKFQVGAEKTNSDIDFSETTFTVEYAPKR